MLIRALLAIASTAILCACGGGGSSPFGSSSAATSDEIEPAMKRVIESSDTEFFIFGGAVATCQALSCPQADRIYLRSSTAAASQADTSGFVFIGERNGVLLAKKEGQIQTRLGTNSFHSLGGWMSHTVFRLDVVVDAVTYAGKPEDLVRYELFSTGDAMGTNPVPPPVGSAFWSGAMAGVVIPAGTELDGSFVSGDARITIPHFDSDAPPSVDIEFSNIVNERTGAGLRDMAWEEVEMSDGAFASPRLVSPINSSDVDIQDKALETGIFGRFYGPGHEEVGGVFIRDGISGAFGAGRDE